MNKFQQDDKMAAVDRNCWAIETAGSRKYKTKIEIFVIHREAVIYTLKIRLKYLHPS